MNINTRQAELIKRRTKRVAREFEREGYQVLVEPEAEKLPQFIADHQPKLIAHRQGETVIVEITSTPALIEQAAQLQSLAEEIQRRPSWRFELVVTNPRGSPKGELYGDLAHLNKREVYIRLGEVQDLLEARHNLAAFLLLGSALEATLRLLVCKEDIPIQQEEPLYLLKQLLSLSVIFRQDYELLRQAMDEYTAITHGIHTTEPEYNYIQELVRTTMRLLRS